MATAERFNIFSRSHSPLDPQSRKIYLILESSHLLSLFLSFLEWDNFYALLNACKRYQLLFEDAALRDVILSRYVPWYAHALRLRDPLGGYKDVPVSLKDLDLLRKLSGALVRFTSPLPATSHFPAHSASSIPYTRTPNTYVTATFIVSYFLARVVDPRTFAICLTVASICAQLERSLTGRVGRRHMVVARRTTVQPIAKADLPPTLIVLRRE
jgi:hypothetical protein